MADLFRQLKLCQCVTIIHYTLPLSTRVVDSLHHNHAFYHVTPREFGNNDSAHSQSKFMF